MAHDQALFVNHAIWNSYQQSTNVLYSTLITAAKVRKSKVVHFVTDTYNTVSIKSTARGPQATDQKTLNQ